MINSHELKQRTELLKEACRRSGVRLTQQRVEIFREVAGSTQHPDAETIHAGVRARLPGVSLDTVYRTLWLLKELGLVSALGPPWGRARFDANMRQHHHFTCTRCGETMDFYSDDLNRLSVPAEVLAYGSVQTTQVEMRGTCLRCAQAEPKRTGLGRAGRRS